MTAALLALALTIAAPVAPSAPPVEAKARASLGVDLPSARRAGPVSLESALQHRRSVRRFAEAPLSLEQVGQLLRASQGTNRLDGRRTIPSAGALYPLEIYLVAGEVDGLSQGAWRHRPGGHRLVRVAASDRRERLAGHVQGFALRAPALIAIAGVVERTALKYGSRAERYVQLEAGCASQGVLLQAVALGLGCVPVGAFDDGAVRNALGLRSGESPLLLIPVGRPRE